MKKLITMVLALCILLSLYVPSSFAEEFDMDYYRGLTEVLTIRPNSGGYAFIDLDDFYSIRDRSFTHPYEHPSKYSYIKTDIIVLDYFDKEPYPCLRTWIDVAATKNLGITSATFVFDDKEFTFTGLADKERFVEDDNGTEQTLLIKYDDTHAEYLAYYLSQVAFDALEYSMDQTGSDVTLPIILHGSEDIEIEMSHSSLVEFALLFISLDQSNGLSYFYKTDGTKFSVKDR